MTDNKEKRGLGRGLSALLGDIEYGSENETTSEGKSRGGQELVPIELIHPNKNQPRRDFQEYELNELAISIKECGIIQPLIVRKLADDHYQIVAGERRWRAAQLASQRDLPVIVRDYSDVEVAEIALIENIQREDLNVVEEALAYRALMKEYAHTQETLSEALGKSRPHIANLLRLLNLPDDVLQYVRKGELSMGHARALLAADDPSALAKRVVKQGLNVRQVEKMVKAAASGAADSQAPAGKVKDIHSRVVEQELSAALGTKVAIDHNMKTGRGTLTISYDDLDGLDHLTGLLMKS